MDDLINKFFEAVEPSHKLQRKRALRGIKTIRIITSNSIKNNLIFNEALHGIASVPCKFPRSRK